MPLIKHRPQLSLRAPSVIVPGVDVGGVVVVDAGRDVPIDAITVDLVGEERVTIGSGSNSRTHRAPIIEARATLSGPRTVPAGRHELPFTFSIPNGSPPSYGAGRGVVEYRAKVRVDIDWWPDATQNFVLNVGHEKLPEPKAPIPRAYSTSPAGPVGDRPGLEVSLASEVVPLGGTIEIAVGVPNSDSAGFREVRVALRPIEKRFDHTGRLRETMDLAKYEVQVPMERVRSGSPFRFAVPDVFPTFHARLFHVDWVLDVTGVVPWGRDVEMRLPLELTPRGGVQQSTVTAPPPVGSSRQREVWQHVATQQGFDFDGREMTKRVGEVEAALRLGRRKDGAVLVGELRYPSLHLALDGGEKGSFHRLLKDSVEIADPRMSDRHYVAGRDEAQVRAFVGGLGDAFFATLLEDLDDVGMTLVSRGHTTEGLTPMCEAVRRLAEALPRARGAIPPPAALAPHLATWQVVATREAAVFEPARMALHFSRGHDRSAVITEWNAAGVPYRTTVALAVADPIDVDYHFLSTGAALLVSEAQHYAADARLLLGWLVEATPHVRVEANALVAHLEPQLEDPTHAVTVLRRLEALCALLRGAVGPYR